MKEKAPKRQKWGLPLWGFNYASFSEKWHFWLFWGSLSPAGLDKNTVSGAALSLAVSGLFGSLRWSPFYHFFFGGGVCIRCRSTRGRSRHSRANKKKTKKKKRKNKKKKRKKKKEEEEEEESNRKIKRRRRIKKKKTKKKKKKKKNNKKKIRRRRRRRRRR